MSNKYIIHGATYCGDGTSSAEATSAGGVGAWNSITFMTGTTPTYGTLAAGDVVYIRSKSSAGADITVTLSATTYLGSANATSAAWITWVLDTGTVWSGISGTLTFSCGSTYALNLRTYNNFVSQTQGNFVIYESLVSGSKAILTSASSVVAKTKNLVVNLGDQTSNGSFIQVASSSLITHENLKIVSAKRTTNCLFNANATNSKLLLINPTIVLTDATTTNPLFYSQYDTIEVIGGSISGAGATTGVSLFYTTAQGGKIQLVGTDFPKQMSLYSALPTGYGARFEALGFDDGIGAALVEPWGSAVSRSTLNHPTCNATVPDSASTGWAWKIYPAAASLVLPARMAVAKLFTDTAAAKTVTMELLVGDAFSAINQSTLWIDVHYIDSNDVVRCESSKLDTATALASSSATWTAVVYGSANFVKRSLSVTTSYAVKQDSLVTTVLRCTAASSTADDVLFMDPDVKVL